MKFKALFVLAIVHCSAFAITHWEPNSPAPVAIPTVEEAVCQSLLAVDPSFSKINYSLLAKSQIQDILMMRIRNIPLIVLTDPKNDEQSLIPEALTEKLQKINRPFVAFKTVQGEDGQKNKVVVVTNIESVKGVLKIWNHVEAKNMLKIPAFRRDLVSSLPPNTFLHFDLPLNNSLEVVSSLIVIRRSDIERVLNTADMELLQSIVELSTIAQKKMQTIAVLSSLKPVMISNMRKGDKYHALFDNMYIIDLAKIAQ